MVYNFSEYDGGDGQPLQKYVLFHGSRYYPSEGAKDLRATADTVGELESHQLVTDLEPYHWWQICEVATLRVVIEGEWHD